MITSPVRRYIPFLVLNQSYGKVHDHLSGKLFKGFQYVLSLGLRVEIYLILKII